MPINEKYLDELLGVSTTAIAEPPKPQKSRINIEFLDSLLAGEHPEVQQNKLEATPPQITTADGLVIPPRQLDPATRYAPEDPEAPPIMPEPGRAAEVLGAGAEVVERTLKQFWNKGVARPADILGASDSPALLKAVEVQQARMKGRARYPEDWYDDELKEIMWQLGQKPQARDDPDLKGVTEIYGIGEDENPFPKFNIPPSENAGDYIADTVAGIGSFIAQLVFLKKVLPGAPSQVIWEIQNIAAGGKPGRGAAINTALKGISQIPSVSTLGKATKVAAGGGLFGGLAYKEGGDWVDVAVSTGIGMGFQGWDIHKQNQWLKSFKSHLKKAEYAKAQKAISQGQQQAKQAYQQDIATGMKPAQVQANYQRTLRDATRIGERQLRDIEPKIDKAMDIVAKKLHHGKMKGKEAELAEQIVAEGLTREAARKVTKLPGKRKPREELAKKVPSEDYWRQLLGPKKPKKGAAKPDTVVVVRSAKGEEIGYYPGGTTFSRLPEGATVTTEPMGGPPSAVPIVPPRLAEAAEKKEKGVIPPSKAAEAKPEGKVYYHGTSAENLSKIQKEGFVTKRPDFGGGFAPNLVVGIEGIYLSKSQYGAKKFAKTYDKGKVVKVEVNLKNPFVIDSLTNAVIKDLEQRYVWPKTKSASPQQMSDLLKEGLQAEGYDGIIVKRWQQGGMYAIKEPQVIVFSSDQVSIAQPAKPGGAEIATSIGAARSPELDRILTNAARTTTEAYVRQVNGKWVKAKKQPEHGSYYRIKDGGAKFVKSKSVFDVEKHAIQAARYIAKNTAKPVYLWQTVAGFHVADTKPDGDFVQINPKGPGLTREERRILGTPQKIAEAEISQEGKEKVGYKVGRKAGLVESRKKLDAFRMAGQLTDKHRQDALDIVKQYVPKEQQYRYTKRILAAKTNKRIERLTEAIDTYLDRAEHRQAVSDFRKFVKETSTKYRRGTTELGKLRSDVRDKLLGVLARYDIAKLSEAKREQFESRQDYIKNVSGTVADALESLAEDGADVLRMPDARTTELMRLSKTHIGELDADQVRYIQASLEHLLAIAARKGDIKERIRAEKVRDLVHTARGEVSQRTKEPGTLIEKQGAGGFAGKLLTTSQATPRTLVGMLTGKDNAATVELITDRLYDGHEKKTAKAKEFVLAARKEFADTGLDGKTFTMLDKKVPITLGGKTFKVDLDNLLSIYMHIRAEGNLRRLLKTKGLNITIYERDPSRLYVIRKKTHIMTGRPQLSELREIIELAENTYPTLEKMSEASFKINTEYQAPAINETSMEYQNYEIARSKKYWPVHRARGKTVEGTATDISVSIENQGRYLPRTGGNERIRIVPFRQEFIAGLQSDATYYGMTMAMRDLRALVGDKAWQDKMNKLGRGRELDALITMLRRVQGHATDRTFIDVTGAKILSNFGKSVLSLRLSGYGVQTASIPAAFEVIEPKHFHGLRNIAALPKVPVRAVKEMMDLSPRLWMRWTGRQFDFVTGGAAAQNAFDTLVFKGSTITEKGVRHYTWGDQKAIYHIYLAAQNKVVAETGLKRGTDEFKERAIKLVEQALETQPQWDMVYRSILTSSPNVFLRGSTMFMSARNAQYNVLLRALDDYKKKRINSVEFGKRVSGVLYANTLVALVKRLVRLGVKAAVLGLIFAISSDDEERQQKVKLAARAEVEKLKGQLPIDAALNLVSLPAFGNIAQGMAYEAIKRFRSQYRTHRLQDIRTGNIFADLSLDATGVVGDTAQLAKQLATGEKFKSGCDKDKPKWQRTARQVANGLAGLLAVATGMPYSAPLGEVYYQAKSATAAVEKIMTVDELKEAIAKNTYKTSYRRKGGKLYPRGHPHSGKEEMVEGWRKELESRKSG